MFKEELTELRQFIQNTVDQVVDISHKDYIYLLTERLQDCATKMNAIGETAFSYLEKDEELNNDTIQSYQLTFHWMEEAKFFLVLWRDTLIVNQKAYLLFQNGKTHQDAIEDLRSKSNQSLLDAATEMTSYFENNEISTDAKVREKSIHQWERQTNPFPVYKEQIAEIAKQTVECEKEAKKLFFTSNEFERIRDLIRKTIIDLKGEIADNQQRLKDVVTFVEENAEKTPGKIVKRIEEVEKEISNLTEIPSRLSTQLKKETEALPAETNVAVSTEHGLVQVREVHFRRITRQWLESEILPLLYEVGEITKSVRTGLKLSLLNVRNRVVLMLNEQKDGEHTESPLDLDDLNLPLQEFSETVAKLKTECEDHYKLVTARLKNEFDITKIYGGTEEFLSIPLQNTINRLVFGQTDVGETLKKWWNRVTGKIRAIKLDVEREDSLSISEKVVRYLDRRAPDPKNGQYSAIFLTEGYVGESFRVGRTAEIARADKLIEQWSRGYRGAVLLSGQRFSGKTLFGEYILERSFSNNYYVIRPNKEVKVQGRTLPATDDLKEALNFIKKYAGQSNSAIFIDDLELWGSGKKALAENVAALQKFTDNNSNKLFIIVSLSNWLKAHLDKSMDFDRYFQAEINLDFMPKEDVKRAIAIRHGATHKKLVDHEGEEVEAQKFSQLTTLTYSRSEGNIGEALLSWANSLEKTEKGEVRRHFNADPPLPDFITSDTAVLLTTVMLHRRINEYELSKLFGNPWNTKYRSILQRLLGLGLLKRSADGKLIMTDTAVNDVGRILDKHRYLKFKKD